MHLCFLSTQELIILIFYRFLFVIVGLYILKQGNAFFLKPSNGLIGHKIAFWGIKISKATPGILYTVIGFCIIIYSMLKGVEIVESNKETKPIYTNTTERSPFDSISESAYVDTTIPKERLSVDSLTNLALQNIQAKKQIEAFKLLYLTKGILIQKGNSDSLINVINSYINKLDIKNKPPQSNSSTFTTTSEETRAVKIGEEQIDSTNY